MRPLRDGPAAEGEIVKSYLSKRMRGARTFYRTMISYRYEVDGKRYEGDRLRFVNDARRDLTNSSESFSDLAEAQGVVRHYPRGKKVPVYYNPDDPTVAVLVKGEVFGQSPSIVLGAIIAAVGALYLLLSLLALIVRQRERRRFSAQLAAQQDLL